MATTTQAKKDMRDALDELGAQLNYVCLTLGPRDMTAAALDVLEGELGRKMTLVRECAEVLRATVEDMALGESAFPRRRS